MKIGINSGSISNTTLKAWSPSHEEFRLTLLTATIGTKDGTYLVRCAGTERTNAGTEKIAYLLILDGDSRIDENGEVVKTKITKEDGAEEEVPVKVYNPDFISFQNDFDALLSEERELEYHAFKLEDFESVETDGVYNTFFKLIKVDE